MTRICKKKKNQRTRGNYFGKEKIYNSTLYSGSERIEIECEDVDKNYN